MSRDRTSPGSRALRPVALITLLVSLSLHSWGAAASTPAGAWTWPTGEPGQVVNAYAPPAVAWGSGHRGVDLLLAPGSPVLAAGAGMVIFAGILAGRGVISVEHAGGLRTTYEPVTAVVAAGAAVGGGELLGYLDAGHCPEGCLHFGLKIGADDYRDPLSLFAVVPVRLLPLLRHAGVPV